MRHAARTDDIQPEVIKALRSIGASVYYLKLPLDLLVCFKGRTLLVECKDEDGRITKQQAQFLEMWPGEVHIVRSPKEAIEACMFKLPT